MKPTQSLLRAFSSGGGGGTAIGKVVELTILQPNVPKNISR